MVLYGKAVRLVLKPRYHIESLGSSRKFNLFIVVVKASGSVVVILYHSTYRDRQAEIIQNLKCDIHLTASTIHHEYVRKYIEFFVGETAGEDLLHTCVIIRTVDGSEFEFAVVIFLGTSVFKYNHGCNRVITAYVRYIKCFQPPCRRHTYQICKLPCCSLGAFLFTL